MAVLIRQIESADNPYAVLTVARAAPLPAIKLQHRFLAGVLHPDRCGEPGAAAAMARVNVAWDCLSNPRERRKLDLTLSAGAAPLCAVCKGSGTVTAQKGFKGTVTLPCLVCKGKGQRE